MTPAIPITEALADPNLLGAALGDVASWRTWRAILKAAFAEPLTDEERALFAWWPVIVRRRHGGYASCGAGPIGRRSGKSRMAAAVAVHIALLTDHRKRLVPGEIGTVAVIAASRAGQHGVQLRAWFPDGVAAVGWSGCEHRPRRDHASR